WLHSTSCFWLSVHCYIHIRWNNEVLKTWSCGGTRGNRRVHPGDLLHPIRRVAGSGAEDPLRSRAIGVGWTVSGVRTGIHYERAVPLAQGSKARSRRVELRRGGIRLYVGRAGHRSALGETDMGRVLDVGRAPHADAVSLVHLRRLHNSTRGDR